MSDIPELDIEDNTERQTALFARYGRPEHLHDRAAALRFIGKRAQVHPDDVIACTYPTRECAEAFAEANRRHGGLPSLGIAEYQGTWLGVTDLRPQLGAAVTGPAAPDDKGTEWRKQYPKRAAG